MDSDGDGQLDAQAQCTGTVVAPQWIVSAAHCAFRPDDQGVDAMVTLTGDALLIHLRSAGSAPPHAVAQQHRARGDGAVQDRALGRQTAMMSRIEMMPWTSPSLTTTR